MPRSRESQGKAFGEEVPPPKVMVTRDLSPLSPVKKRYLGDQADRGDG